MSLAILSQLPIPKDLCPICVKRLHLAVPFVQLIYDFPAPVSYLEALINRVQTSNYALASVPLPTQPLLQEVCRPLPAIRCYARCVTAQSHCMTAALLQCTVQLLGRHVVQVISKNLRRE